ncbi:hypothetical protein GTY86_35595 [Streptomyces sp. SID5770]|uniref:hypothetical protein n=1 Tax=Streptomyces sp. SID5770 TaxID=2690308 RepID=UPI00136DAA0A|nr:hypothetical protein [Streptomyces sp. SID5770]MZE53810.1 hypothetical protein [Streptomyces sp. SID5770]MZE56501.1 hypothetical protein [Streptomyces sp. SID5770]
MLARLGVPTGDGRIIDPAGGASRDLPLPLMWQELSDDGHGGSRVVGRIETLRIADGMVTATGSLLADIPYSVIEQLEAGVVGPSVDLDDIEYVMDDEERLIITRWRIAGATLVSIPAFADVSLTLDPLPAEPITEPEPAPMDAMWASAAPEQLPPADWFKRPDVDRLTPLTVTDTGRVFGHIAGWDTCHVGLPGCVTPPSSPTGYTYFHVAEQRTADGATLPVGTLVAGPRHADAQLAFRAAQEHYDDPAAAVARVVAGEDEYGIWVAGWLLPGATAEALDVFRTSPVSGDWRRVGGALELIGVCSVNVPGFPVRRVHFAAGHQRALIGSFGITPQQGDHFRSTANVIKEETDIARARLRWALATTNQEA